MGENIQQLCAYSKSKSMIYKLNDFNTGMFAFCIADQLIKMLYRSENEWGKLSLYSL